MPAGTRAQQASIEEGTEAIARQVREAAGKHALVSPGLESAIGFAQRQMRAAREQLEQAQPNVPAAQGLAEDALDALNATVYALARSKEAVSGARSGSGFQEAVEQLAALPRGAGIPAVIKAAQGHANPEVRSEAWRQLRESDDPRARAFLRGKARP